MWYGEAPRRWRKRESSDRKPTKKSKILKEKKE